MDLFLDFVFCSTDIPIHRYTDITLILGNVSHPKLLFFFKIVWLFLSRVSQLWNYWHFAQDNS